ncbi:MAG TPA: hypothetical protein VIQ24_22090 [Pyrinomonadaceae bacterium]
MNARFTGLAVSILIAAAAAPLVAQKTDAGGGQQRAAKKISTAAAPLAEQFGERARQMISNTADESLKWDDRITAVRVMSRAADLLWVDDPERARRWLRRAWEVTGGVSVADAGGGMNRLRGQSPRSTLYTTVLLVAQRHDPELANQFIGKLADEKEKSAEESRRGVFDDRTARSEQLLNLALAVADENPTLAANIAEQSLVDGISFQLQLVLLILHRRDPKAANRLFDAALDHLSTAFAHASEGQAIASYLFTPGRVTGTGQGNGTSLAVVADGAALKMTPAQADPARARQFLKIMHRVLLNLPAPSSTPNPTIYAQEIATLVGSLRGGFSLYAPDLLPSVEHRMADFIPDLRPATGASSSSPRAENMRINSNSNDEQEINKLYLEALEEAADKETDLIARKLAYVRVALMTKPEDLARGQRIATKIDDAELRKQVISFLIYRTALHALEKDQIEKAVELASAALPLPQAIVLITAAQRLTGERSGKNVSKSTGSDLHALELLSEAERLLKREDKFNDTLRVRLGLVAALAAIDATRALAAWTDLIDAINQASSFDPVETSAPRLTNLQGFSTQLLLPRIPHGYGLKDAVTPLARADFESSVSIASKLTVPSVRGLCMMEIAQSILEAKPEAIRRLKTEPIVKSRN